MTALLLEPHPDDAVLFATYTLLRHRPHVVTCMGGEDTERRVENMQALNLLELAAYEFLPVRDDAPDWEMLESLLRDIEARERWDVVFAPAVELGGHDHHNTVGALAEEIFGAERLVPYMTYVRGHGRTRTDNAVPREPGWPAVKFRAMAAYVSQINQDTTRSWFSDWEGEWYE